MAKNAFFRLTVKNAGTFITTYPPVEGGSADIRAMDVFDYLDKVVKFPYDKPAVNTFFSTPIEGVKELLLTPEKVNTLDEVALVDISMDRLSASVRFYPPMDGGRPLTKDQIVQEMVKTGVKYGVDNTVIEAYMSNRQYIKSYVMAKATPQIEGHDAEIKYFFNTDLTMKPKLNEDGSVDFHQLDMISPVTQGQLIAELTPMDPGRPGIDVMGKIIKQVKTRNRTLRGGKNIKISDDGLRAYSEISGHASLEGEMMFVSNTFEVAANVDTSTGDIDYDGNVTVHGNVNTGYSVSAKGDILVQGVVEGANLTAGGNIILQRGVSGMEKAVIKAGGNVISKFIESATVFAGGYVTADSIMHSDITAKGDITADGKKGFISGGVIRSTSLISARNIGSNLGATTVLECGIDSVIVDEYHALDKELADNYDEMEKLVPIIQSLLKRLKLEGKLPPDKLLQLKRSNADREKMLARNEEIEARMKELKEQIDAYEGGAVRAEGTIHPGCKIVISNAVYYVKTDTTYCRFSKEKGDVKLDAYY